MGTARGGIGEHQHSGCTAGHGIELVVHDWIRCSGDHMEEYRASVVCTCLECGGLQDAQQSVASAAMASYAGSRNSLFPGGRQRLSAFAKAESDESSSLAHLLQSDLSLLTPWEGPHFCMLVVAQRADHKGLDLVVLQDEKIIRPVCAAHQTLTLSPCACIPT